MIKIRKIAIRSIKSHAIFMSPEKIIGIGPMNIIPFFFSCTDCTISYSISFGKEKKKRMNERKMKSIPNKLSNPLPIINGKITIIPPFASPVINAKISKAIPEIKSIAGNLLSISPLPPLVRPYCFQKFCFS